MRKILFIMFITFLICSFKVKSLELDCKNDSLMINDSLECDLLLISDNNLKNLSFDLQTDLDIFFKSNDYLISQNSSHVMIDFEDNYNNNIISSVTVKASPDITLGDNKILFSNIIVIDKEDNELKLDDVDKIITINESNKSNDCFLTKIIVDGLELSDFSSNKTHYNNIYVNKQIIFIDAVRHSEKTSVTGLGNVRVKPNETITRVLHVTAENGDAIDYVLEITNAPAPMVDDITPDVVSNDNRIKNLFLYYQGEIIKLNFDSAKTVYNVVMPRSDMNRITVKATLNNDKASFVKNYEPKDYAILYGDNMIELRVKAENGNILTYKINVTRNDDRNCENRLSSLRINNQEIKLENSVFDYAITLMHDEMKTKIEAVPVDEKAEIIYQDIDLVDGDNPLLVIKVIAENGNAKQYKIKINRLKKAETKVTLKSIKVNGYNFLFDINSYSYDLDIDKDIEKLDIVVQPSNIHYEIEGNANLEEGSLIKIKVMDTEKHLTYTINVHKPVEEKFTFVYYSIFGIGTLLFILIITYFISVRKKK